MNSNLKFKISNFLEELRNLPEEKKKIVFFSVMAFFVLITGFFGIALTKNNFRKISESLKLVDLPKIDLESDFKASFPDINLNNISSGDLEVMVREKNEETGNVTRSQSGELFR